MLSKQWNRVSVWLTLFAGLATGVGSAIAFARERILDFFQHHSDFQRELWFTSRSLKF